MISPALQTALKEWHIVCQALESGQQVILLRKGGILESSTGFELEHEQFLLFPTYVHQNPTMLKPHVRENLQFHSTEPSKITLTSAAKVTEIVRLKYREQMNALDSEYIWTPPLIDMRFNYKPQNPLYLLIVRAYKLKQSVTIDNTPEYAGCKSWVPLEQPIDTTAAVPAIADLPFQARQQVIRSKLESISA